VISLLIVPHHVGLVEPSLPGYQLVAFIAEPNLRAAFTVEQLGFSRSRPVSARRQTPLQCPYKTNNNKKFLKMSQTKLIKPTGRVIGIDEILHTDLNNLNSYETLIVFYSQAENKALTPNGLFSDKEVPLKQR
jgi:hypothetical protein